MKATCVKVLVALGCLLSLGFVNASEKEAYEKEDRAKEVFSQKFRITRDTTGAISSVTYKMGSKKFSAETVLKEIISEIKSINRQAKLAKTNVNNESQAFLVGQKNMTEHEAHVALAIQEVYGDYELSLAKNNGSQYAHPNRDARIEHLRLSMESLQNDEVLSEFDRIAKSEYWQNFNAKLNNILLKIRPEVLAVPNDQRYFFQRELIAEIAKQILSQASQRIKSVPFLGLLSNIFGQIEQIISDQRMFNQNYLLFLLENYKAELFDLSEKEAAQIISSIYQSKLGLLQLLQMKKMADADWLSYGWNNFYTQKRAANGVLEKFESISYDPRSTKRLSSAFAVVSEKEKKKIVNLYDKAHMFSSKPSLAYDYEKPNKVKMMRFLIKLGQMGLDFVPMPSIIKGLANNFADSAYKQQILTEGALSAYFMVEGHAALSSHFARQTLNPYLR